MHGAPLGICSRVFGEFDGEDGHVVGRFAPFHAREGGGEHVFGERLRVERAQRAEIRAQVGVGSERRRHAVAHEEQEVARLHGHAQGRGTDGVEHPDGQRFSLKDLQLPFGQQKARGRADLHDVRAARIQADGGKVEAGKTLVGREGDQAIDGREHRFGGHPRLIKTF